MLEIIHQTVHN